MTWRRLSRSLPHSCTRSLLLLAFPALVRAKVLVWQSHIPPHARVAVFFLDQSATLRISPQILLFFNGVWLVLFWAIMLGVFIWKGVVLPYPPGNRLAGEVVLLFAHGVVEFCRLLLGSKGNKTEQKTLILLFVVLSLVSALVNVFYFILQTYVLRLDFIINIVSLVFIGLELILSLVAAITF